jgi:hypothetical protein
LALDTETPARESGLPPWRARARRLRPEPQDVLALAAFVLLTMWLFRGAWRHPMTTWVGGPGDPPFFMWLLRWLPHALTEGQNPFYTHHLNFPDGVNLMWNTAVPLPALLLAPFTLLVGPVFAYNVLVTAAVALSGCTAYVMLRRYVIARSAAFTGALLYGFSPYILSHAHEHPNLTAAFIPPLLLLLLDDILVRQRRSAVRSGLMLGGLTFAQLMISEEVLATQALVAVVALAILMALHPRQVRSHARHAATALGVGLVTALALGSFPLLFQFFGPRRVRTGALWGPDLFVSDLLGFVIPRGHLRFTPSWTTEVTKNFTDACCASEWSSYLGVPLLVLMIVITARLWSRPLVRLAGLLSAATALLSMGPHLHVRGYVSPMALPFAEFAELPVVGNMLAARLMLYVYLMAAIILAVALDHLLREPRRSAAAVALAGAALLPLLPRLDFPSTRASTPAFFRSEVRERIAKNGIVLVAPFARDTSTSAPMLWQAEADMHYRMPEGYSLGPDRSGRFTYLPIPTTLSRTMEQLQRGAPVPTLDAPVRAQLVADLARARVQTVLVGPMANQETMVAFFQQLLGREPVKVGGVTLWTGVDPSRLG